MPKQGIRLNVRLRCACFMIAILLCASVPAGAVVIYVDADATGDNNGTSWEDAYVDLAVALAAAGGSDTVWVAEGTYRPTAGLDRTLTFELHDSLAVYGGFAGWETSLEERDFDTNITILSGDIGVPDDSTDNSYHVVLGDSIHVTGVLDGFTITGGNANSSGNHDQGGGVYLRNKSNLTLSNLIFTRNHASNGGGGLSVAWSHPVVRDVKFFDNTSEIYSGGMHIGRSWLTLQNAVFKGNATTYDGGAIYNYIATPRLINVLFFDNTAGQDGGALFNHNSDPVLTNVTFCGNTAGNQGGGMCSDDGSDVTIINTIMWGDSAASGGAEIYNAGTATDTISYSLVAGCGGSGGGWNPAFGFDAGNNIDDDPLYFNAPGGNLHLFSSSPAVDAGSNGAPDLPATDLDGRPRVVNGTVDMGAYESACHKEGDPGFFVGIPEETRDVIAGESVYWAIAPANFGFVSATCPGTDTFCVDVIETAGWTITGDPPLGDCFLLVPATFAQQDIGVTVPCDAEAGDKDTLYVIMSYCTELVCSPQCGDCEDPNWYGGNPYFSTDTVVLNVLETPPALSILQDSLTLIDQGNPGAGVLFQICDLDLCKTEDFEYKITSRGWIGDPLDVSDTVTVEPGKCEDVIAVLDASESEIGDLDTLTITAWSLRAPVVYDTCVQLVQVAQPPAFVPILTAPGFALLVLALAAAAAFFMRKRSGCAGRIMMLLIFMCLTVSLTTEGSAREKREPPRRIKRTWPASGLHETGGITPSYLQSPTAVDTYNIVRYDFFLGDWQGWTRVDNTAQRDTFFHVDDFSGLGGGAHGRLNALEGMQSMWCGARPGFDEYTCQWDAAPGYGNGWHQLLITNPMWLSPPITISYRGRFDSERDYDKTYIEYDIDELNWQRVATYDGVVDTTASHTFTTIYTGMDDLRSDRILRSFQVQTKFRILFMSDGAWSDEDALHNTDGACILDSITISDQTGIVDYEDFESAAVGDRNVGVWRADVKAPYGMYSGLVPNLQDKDPCGDNSSHQIVFFVGSDEASAEYPGLYDTPFCTGAGGIEEPCQDEMVVSPPIDMTRYSTGNNEVQNADIPPGDLSSLGGALLKFTVYRDLPVDNLVFYYWRVRLIENGCPSEWLDRMFVYYSPIQDYHRHSFEIGDLVIGDSIQVAIGTVDMCSVWYGVYGDCAAHTPAPWIDNVQVQRYETVGPQWYYSDSELFQDNFPGEEFALESWVRADMAVDLRPLDDPVIDPGDSVVVRCTSPLAPSDGYYAGIDSTVDGRPRVFMNVRCSYIGDPAAPKPPIAGPQLAGTYGTYYGDDGTWTVIQGEAALTGAGNWNYGHYMFDLHDSLFTRGYLVEYYFKADDTGGLSSTLPPEAESGQYFEFTCLPTFASDILYVDDYHGIGSFDGAAHDYLGQAFKAVLPDTNQPDRYDVNAPDERLSNGPGSRATNYPMTSAYKKIIWDSGDMDICTISDGKEYSDKSNDCQMLIDWMEFSPHECGLWVLGDNIAEDLDGSPAPVAAQLMSSYCGIDLASGSYYELTGGFTGGGETVPLVKGASTGIFHHGGVPDSFYVLGNCPAINSFDVFGNICGGQYAMAYPDFGGTDYYSAIQNTLINYGGHTVRTMWFGHSFMHIADPELQSPIMRYHIMKDVIEWMENAADTNITDGGHPPAYTYSLEQNYPNPFNPSTTFRFSMRERAHVSIRIYDVSGRLVRVLVDEVRDAGPHSVQWRGRNDRGSRVSSGIYFARMESGDFTRVRKTVLLR